MQNNNSSDKKKLDYECGYVFSGIQVLDIISNENSVRELGYKSGKELNTSALLEKDEELFYGVWGRIYNRFSNSRATRISETIGSWKSKIFDDEDPRFLESTKKGTKKEQEENKPPKRLPQRFFLITTNMDGDMSKAGFHEKEFYEMNGNAVEWQCRAPCKKYAWKVDEEFRFEVDGKTGRAPPIKYVEKSTKMLLMEQEISRTQTLKENLNDSYFTGDKDMYNPRDPFGRFEFTKTHHQRNTAEADSTVETQAVAGKEHQRSELRKNIIAKELELLQQRGSLSKTIAEKRSMYFRYFTPANIATRAYQEGNHLQTLSSHTTRPISTVGSVLRQLYPSMELVDSRGEHSDATLIRHNLRISDGAGIQHEASDQTDPLLIEQTLIGNDRSVTYDEQQMRSEEHSPVEYNEELDSDMDDADVNRVREENEIGCTLQSSELREEATMEKEELYQFDNETHELLHQSAFEGRNITYGSANIVVIDSMIHHHAYYTRVPSICRTEETFKIIQGSDSSFYVTLQIKDLSPTLRPQPTMKYSFGEVRPNVRKQRSEDGTYVDCIILDMQRFCLDNDRNELPFSGRISVIVEPVRPKRKISRTVGNSGHVFREEEDPWQIVGQYDIVELKYRRDDEDISRNPTRRERLDMSRTFRAHDASSSGRLTDFGDFQDDDDDNGSNNDFDASSGFKGIITADSTPCTGTKHLVDFIFRSQTRSHSLVLRTVEHEDFSHDIVNVFIYLPVSMFDPGRQSQYHEHMQMVAKSTLSTSPNTTRSFSRDTMHSSRSMATGITSSTTSNPTPSPIPPLGSMTASLIPPPQTILPVSGAEEDEHTVEKMPDEDDLNKRPLVNRIMCVHCHSLARPRVKMGLGDKAWFRTPMKKYKAWTQAAIKTVKETPEKPLVILELGCEARLRKQTDVLMKQTKIYGTVLIRVNPQGIKSKKKGSGATEEEDDDQIILIEESCPSAIDKVEQYIWDFFNQLMSKVKK